MEILGHIIDDNEIIGIGPLCYKHSSDQTMYSLYNAQHLLFEVHCRQRSIQVTSNQFLPGQPPDVDEKEVLRYDEWKESYNHQVAKINKLVDSRKYPKTDY